MNFYQYASAFYGLSIREIKKFSKQKGRLFSTLVRPALWLFVFAAGVGSAKGVDPGILNFYPTQNVNYFEYITPGLLGMVLLFSGMQSSLSMVWRYTKSRRAKFTVKPSRRERRGAAGTGST